MTRFGGWVVVGEAGRGGAGRVLRGRGPRGEDVAIKLIPVRSRGALERFQREVHFLRELGEAEGFVPLLDAGFSPEGAWIVMPFLPGGTLRDRLARGPLDVDDAIELAGRLARALGLAHARGIVHRDVKPENVLFTADGVPLVADLGLAKRWETEAGVSDGMPLSVTGELRGTAGTMSPEQMRDAKSAGPPADVFALGTILYEALAGVPAFAADNLVQLVSQVERGVYAPVRSHRREAPPWVEKVLARALAVDPGQRFPDAGALADALAEGGRRPQGRRLLLLGLAVGAAIGAAAVTSLRGPAPGPPPPPAPAPAPPALPPPPVAAAEGLSVRGVLGSLAFRAPVPYRALAVTADGRRVAGLDAKGWIRVFDLRSGEPEHAAHVHDAAVDLAFSPDGKQLLTGGRDGKSVFYDLVAGKKSLTVTHVSPATAAAWASDPRVAAIGAESGEVFFLDPVARKQVHVFKPLPGIQGPVHALAFGPDAQHQLLAGYAGKAVLVRRSDAKDLALETGATVLACAFAPAGDAVALGDSKGSLRVVDLERRAVVLNAEDGKGPIRAVAYAGDALLVGQGELLRVVDVAARSVRSTRACPSPVAAVAAIPGASDFAAALEREPVILRVPLDGAIPLQAPGDAGHVGPVRAVEPLGRGKLATIGDDGTTRVWEADGSMARIETLAGKEELTAFAGAPDLDRFFVATSERTLRAVNPLRHVVKAGQGLPSVVSALAYDGPRSRLVTGGRDGRLRVVDARTLQPVPGSAPSVGGTVTALRALPDAVIAVAAKQVHVLSATSLERRMSTGPASEWPAALAADPANARFAYGRPDGRLGVVRAAAREIAFERELEAHSGEVTAVAWSREGVATAGTDGLVLLWSPEWTRTGSYSLAASGDWATALRFDEGELLVGTARGVVFRLSGPGAR